MRKILTSVLIITAVLTFVFTGCQNPLNSNILDEPDIQVPATTVEESSTEISEPIDTGVTFTMPRYAPWIGVAPASRAFGFVDTISITIKNSSGVEVETETFTPTDATGSENITCSVVLEPAIGYTAEIKIFNHTISSSVPRVSGVSAEFDIIEGVATQVPVTCLPVDVIDAAVQNTDYDFTMLSTPFSSQMVPSATGGEVWYSLVAPSTGFFNIDITVPAELNYFYAVYDSTGVMIMNFGEDIGGPGPGVINGQGVPGETYYMALVIATFGESSNVEVTFNWEAVTPLLIDASAFPDDDLRAAIESIVDNSFTGVEGGITDFDLNSLEEIDLSGRNETYTTLKGLELCDNVRSMMLDSNDLSVCDSDSASAAALSGMDSLTALDIYTTGIDSLDFIVDCSGLTWLNPCNNMTLSYTEQLKINASNFPGLGQAIYTGYDSNSDGISDALTALELVDFVTAISGFSNIYGLQMHNMQLTQTEFQTIYNGVLSSNPGKWTDLCFGENQLDNDSLSLMANLPNLNVLMLWSNTAITSLDNVAGMTSLNMLNISGSSITSLAPLETVTAAGGFSSPVDWTEYAIDVRYCNLEIWPGSDNEGIIEYLEAQWLSVGYEEGNQMSETQIIWENVFANPNGDYIHGITYDGTDLWMVGRGSNTIYRVSSTDFSVLQSFATPTSNNDGTGLTFDGTSLWYTHDEDPMSIYELDPADGSVLSLFSTPGSNDSTGLTWDGTSLWNAGFGETLYQLNTVGTILNSFSAPTESSEGMAYANGFIWIIGWQNTLYKINPSTGEIVDSYSTPNTNLYGLTADGTYLWLSTNDGWIKRYPLAGL